MTALTAELAALVADWPGIGRLRMFGCDAFTRDGRMFCLVSPPADLVVKLAEALAVPGAVPWRPSGRAMGNWVVLPGFDKDWLRRAYDAAC